MAVSRWKDENPGRALLFPMKLRLLREKGPLRMMGPLRATGFLRATGLLRITELLGKSLRHAEITGPWGTIRALMHRRA